MQATIRCYHGAVHRFTLLLVLAPLWFLPACGGEDTTPTGQLLPTRMEMPWRGHLQDREPELGRLR